MTWWLLRFFLIRRLRAARTTSLDTDRVIQPPARDLWVPQPKAFQEAEQQLLTDISFTYLLKRIKDLQFYTNRLAGQARWRASKSDADHPAQVEDFLRQ